ncbi:AAA family ATPase [Streptomyces sp. NPDC008150]|uniref:AAA family ATPase n=1 Tax=Streptomyces sp. NPDC008150 TaxID=3364816 RepID=UPI0036EE3FD4
MKTGSDSTRLVVLRGNSASGKSTVAARVRERHGRGIALVGQDNLRREVLRERDVPDAANIGLIDLTVRYALDHGFHVVLEGILYVAHYGTMIDGLCRDHRGGTHLFYLDVPFTETLARHATKPIALDVTADQLRGWYRPLDLLPGGIERIVGAGSTVEATADLIVRTAGLGQSAAVGERAATGEANTPGGANSPVGASGGADDVATK